MADEKPHIDLNRLPTNPDTAEPFRSRPGVATEGTPAMPADDLVAKVARESMMADRHAAEATRIQVIPPQLEKVEAVQAPAQPVITEAERATIMEQAKKRRGRPPKFPPKMTTPVEMHNRAPGYPIPREVLNTVMNPKERDIHTVQVCASTLINHFRTLSAEWSNKIDAMRTERNLDDLNCVVSLMAFTLDSGNYLVVPIDHAAFQNGVVPAGTNFTCMICSKIQNRVYAGQPALCSDAGSSCPAKYYALSAEDQKELLEANI